MKIRFMVMTPEEFKQKIELIIDDYAGDESYYKATEQAFCDLLTELGYGDAVKAYKSVFDYKLVGDHE